MKKLIPVRVIYRSKFVQYPLMAAMEACQAWERAGLDLVYFDFVAGVKKSDPMLINGEVDFIFGSHFSPYLHRSKGIPMVYVGQTVNWVDDVLVTAKPINSLADLKGKVIADKDADITTNHPHGNHRLYLQQAGIDLSQVNFLETGRSYKPHQAVLDGKADAAIVSPPYDLYAQEAGLYVTRLPYLPMVVATTLTTMQHITDQQPEMVMAVIRAVRYGIQFFKNEEKQMLRLMEEKIGPTLGVKSQDVMHSLYYRNRLLYNESLYPRLDSIDNAFKLACFIDPNLHEKIHPIQLWNMHFLRQLEMMEEGGTTTGGSIAQ